MASPRLPLETRLVAAGLLRRRGLTAIAVLAVAIGASVASAMLHVSADISRRLAHELRALGPNVLVTPPVAIAGDVAPAGGAIAAGAAGIATADAPREFLDARAVGERLARAGVRAAPVLYAIATLRGESIALVGTDLETARVLHPQWRVGAGDARSLVGRRLASRLGLRSGQPVRLSLAGGTSVTLTPGATLEAGGADDECWWLPLEQVQRLSGLEGRASLFQARIEGGVEAAHALQRRLAADRTLRVLPIGSLTAAESQLLSRMWRLMTLVTLAALLSAGVCAFGTLTDRVLEQRRDFALMKSLGAARRRILRQFASEAAVIGVVGGLAGWLFGLLMAQLIGRQVFHTGIAVRWEVPPVVLGLALLVAALSSIGPARLALATEPAAALKGD